MKQEVTPTGIKPTAEAPKQDQNLEKPKLNPKQELFCQFYVKNSELFSNATLAYAEAYEYALEELDRTSEYAEEGETKIGPSEYEKAYKVCSVQGSKLLRNPKIQGRMTELLNEMLPSILFCLYSLPASLISSVIFSSLLN